MTWRRDKLPELVRAMAGRPRHEALRGHVTELLRDGFGALYAEIEHEVYLLDNTGRIDTMWGATVIELKTDLRRELVDVQARMPAYLADAARRSSSPRPVTGIATDGATFIAYQLLDGSLTELRRYTTDPERLGELMAWLEPLLSDRTGLTPELSGQDGADLSANLIGETRRHGPERLTFLADYVPIAPVFQQAPSSNAPSAAERSAADAHHYREVLHELIDMGADLARLVHRHVIAQAEAAVASGAADTAIAPEHIIAFDRVARAVRRTILLAKRLDEDRLLGPTRAEARRKLIREVEDTIQREAKGDEAERLQAEFRERLDAPELENEIGARPVGEIIDDVCRDLGLTAPCGAHPWQRRTPEDVAALFRRAAKASGSGILKKGMAGVVAMPARGRSGRDPPGELDPSGLALARGG